VKKVLGGWWFLSSCVAVLAALLLAVLLPLFVGFLRPWWVRAIVVAVVAAIWGGLSLWRVLSARRASDQLAEQLARPEPADAEAGVLAERMGEALSALRASGRANRDYLYERPWYVIIGPPGAGKTTALLNSGLRFPVSTTAMKGVGGTRNLDFWFADQAVLVDTAGRYTTQDSDGARDQAAWGAFLALLRKNRPLQPVNGVLVAIGLDEIIGANAAAIDAHAAAVRRRLHELQTGLEQSTPVYVLFTKADLIAGFGEFYDDLDVEGRRAVLGATLPWAPDQPLDVGQAGREFDGLAQAVADRMSRRLQDELDPRRRGLIVGFPSQVAALRSRVLRFLEGAFPTEGRGDAAPLRGFYFTSGVQNGAPLDRLLSGMADVYDAPPQTAAAAPGQGGRAYFINRLLSDLVFAEAGLVQTSPAAARRRRLQMAAGFATIGVVSLLTLIAWAISFSANRHLQGQLLASSTDSAQAMRAAGIDLVESRESDPDLESAVAVLRGLRNLPQGYAARRAGGPPLAMGFGLYQGSESRAAEQAYLQALQRVMLPRILLRLERVLRDKNGDALALYEPLKAYLMLGGQAPSLDRKAIKAYVESDWQEQVFPGADRDDLRKELSGHLDALLSDPRFGQVWPQGRAPLDGAVITAARAQVQTLSMADRAYAILKQQAAASGKAGWSARTVLSAGDARAFANGEAVRELSAPYFYTREGFEQAYRNGMSEVQKSLEADLWVLGADQSTRSIAAQMAQVRPGVATLYARDYIHAWEQVVGALQPADYFQDAAAFGAATGSPPPLKLILQEVVRNTSLGAASPAAKKLIPAAVPAGLLPQPETGINAAQAIGEAFAPLRAYVGDGKAPAPVDDFVAKLKAAVTAKGTADRAVQMGGGEAAQADLAKAMSELAAASATSPPLVQAFTSRSSKAGDQAQISSAAGAVASAYADSVNPACRSASEQRYPFVTASANDAPVGDLLRVFGLNGQMDAFISGRLRPLLDTGGPVWRWRADDPVAAAFDPTSAGEFQKAQELRDLLISGVAIKVESAGFGGAVTSAELSAGGQTYRFEPSQAGQRALQWSPSALPEAHVTLFAGAQAVKTFAFEGPWAMFRLMDAARKENAGPTAFRATFGDGASYVTFRVLLPSEKNPFSRGGSWSFRCPPRL